MAIETAALPPRERILKAADELFYRLGIRAVAQKAHAITQPTCDERQRLTAPGLWSGIRTVSTAELKFSIDSTDRCAVKAPNSGAARRVAVRASSGLSGGSSRCAARRWRFTSWPCIFAGRLSGR